jgi:hypothetical protein
VELAQKMATVILDSFVLEVCVETQLVLRQRIVFVLPQHRLHATWRVEMVLTVLLVFHVSMVCVEMHLVPVKQIVLVLQQHQHQNLAVAHVAQTQNAQQG